MFDNIGGKIKALATWEFLIGTLLFVTGGVAALCIDDSLLATGLLLLFVGPLVSWLSSLLIYGLGQLVEDTEMIREVTVAMHIANYRASLKKEIDLVSGKQDTNQIAYCTNCGAKRGGGADFCTSCGQSF